MRLVGRHIGGIPTMRLAGRHIQRGIPHPEVPGRHIQGYTLPWGTREACWVCNTPGTREACWVCNTPGTREACWVCIYLSPGTREACWVCISLSWYPGGMLGVIPPSMLPGRHAGCYTSVYVARVPWWVYYTSVYVARVPWWGYYSLYASLYTMVGIHLSLHASQYTTLGIPPSSPRRPVLRLLRSGCVRRPVREPWAQSWE